MVTSILSSPLSASLTPSGRVLKWFSLSLLAAVFASPLLGNESIVLKAGLVLIFFVATMGLHVIVSWTGDLSLAQGAMVGLPALCCLGLSQEYGWSPMYLIPVAVVIGAVEGAVVAIPTLRASGVQVALVTLIAGIAIERYFYKQQWLVGARAARTSSSPTLGPFHFDSPSALYPVLVVLVLMSGVAMWMLNRSKVGRSWRWIRGNRDAASAFGIPTARYRVAAYAVGGAFGGLAGGMYVAWVQHIGPDSFPRALSFEYLLVVVLSGPGLVGGLFVGTLIIEGGPQFASNIFGNDVGEWLDTLLAYMGPLGLLSVIVQHQTGFNGLGRSLVSKLRGPAHREDVAMGDLGLAELYTPDASDAPPAAEPLLSVEGITVSFGGLRALSDVSLQVAEGTIVGLIGPNGAGKTTLFNVISGLQQASAGCVRLAGQDITKLPPHRRARLGMGRTFQHLGLANDERVSASLLAAQHLSAGYRAWDILLRPWRWSRQERRLTRHAEQAALRAGLADLWDQPVSELSFGDARFTEIACTMVRRPRLLLMDEPTTGLDLAEVERLLEALRLERDLGTTVLVVAHDVRFVMDICDHVFVLTEGQLLVDGPPAEVQTSPLVIEAYLGRSSR